MFHTPSFFYFQLPDITYKVLKVLNLGQKSDIDILCFLHVLKVAESKKVVFKKWSVCMSVNTLEPKRKKIRTSNLVHELLLLVGRDTNVFEKFAHAQRVPAIELFRLYRYCQKTALTIFIKIAVSTPHNMT